MNRLVLFGSLLLALTAFASPAAAQSDDTEWASLFMGQTQLLDIEVGPNAVVFRLHDITVTGTLAADARSAIDQATAIGGDGDGTVSNEEVAGFEAIAAATINTLLPAEFDFEILTIDGRRAFSASADDGKIAIMAVDVKGAEGPVSSTEPIMTDISAKLRFDSVDQSKADHDIRFENVYGDFTSFDASSAPPAEVRITGYKSWSIVGGTIQPASFNERLDDDTITLTNADIAYFDEQGEGLIFEIHGDPSVKVGEAKKGSPGVAPLAAVAVLGALLAALRRR